MKKEKLIEHRGKEKLTLREMAEKLGVSSSYYEKIELGFRNPSYNFMVKFKHAYPEVSADIFFE